MAKFIAADPSTNAYVQPVATVDFTIRKQPTRDSVATFCSSALTGQQIETMRHPEDFRLVDEDEC